MEKLFQKKKKPEVTLKPHVFIETEINEIFAKTKVTQKVYNNSNSPYELEFSIHKYFNILFSSFYAKVGNSLEARSKVIKTEKAEEKYTDSISSGNTWIYTTQHGINEIKVHIGNFPPKEELTFTSEYIQFTKLSDNIYEYDLFNNVPILSGDKGIKFENERVEVILEIKTKNNIKNVYKKLSDKLIIKEEKFEKDNKRFLLKYKNETNLNELKGPNKLYFEINNISYPILFSQKSIKNKTEESFILNYQLTEKEKLIPALFIILFEQNILISPSKMKSLSDVLILLLQSLPPGSYYQFIGFGSDYKVYDEQPKEYNQKNIEESIKILEKLEGYMTGNDLYKALNYIYNTNENYKKILLPKKIFLFSHSIVDNKDKILELIKQNNNEFSIYSFGHCNTIDSDFLKKVSIFSKGIYAFSQMYVQLRNAVSILLNQICVSSQRDLRLFSSLDKCNLIKNKEIAEKLLNQNEIYRFNYLIEEKIDKEKFEFTAEYEYNKEKYSKKYAINPTELPPGEELTKLLIYEYIKNNEDLTEEEKIKLALKYQILIEGTSLFAEVELKEKIKEKMKIKKIKENTTYNNITKKIEEIEKNLIDLEKKKEENRKEAKEKLKSGDTEGAEKLVQKQIELREKMKQFEGSLAMIEEQKLMLDNNGNKMNNKVINLMKYPKNAQYLNNLEEEDEETKKGLEELKEFFKNCCDDYDDKEEVSNLMQELREEIDKESNPENISEEQKLFNAFPDISFFLDMEDYEIEESLKKLIKCQNFVEGFWIINDETKILKTKYEKEFNLLKKFREKNIDDNVAMTIILIYYINKEYSNDVDTVKMILKKAKLYIQNKIGYSYENIIKKIFQ